MYTYLFSKEFLNNWSFLKLLKHVYNETGEPIGKLKCNAPRVAYEEAIYLPTSWMDKVSGNCRGIFPVRLIVKHVSLSRLLWLSNEMDRNIVGSSIGRAGIADVH